MQHSVLQLASESISVAAAAMSVRARRTSATSSFVPGFYRTLKGDVNALSSNTLALSSTGDQLPYGCFLVETVITMRKHKILSDYNSNKITK